MKSNTPSKGHDFIKGPASNALGDRDRNAPRSAFPGKTLAQGVLWNNPVLMKGFALAPLIMAASTLKSAWMLSLGCILLFLPTLLLSHLWRGRLPAPFQVCACVLTGAVVYIPVSLLLAVLFPAETNAAGVFVPLLTVSAACLVLDKEHNSGLPSCVLEGAGQCFGFTLILCTVGAAREIIGRSALWDMPLELPFDGSPAQLPFAGFFLAAFVLALFQFVRGVIDFARARLSQRMERGKSSHLMRRHRARRVRLREEGNS